MPGPLALAFASDPQGIANIVGQIVVGIIALIILIVVWIHLGTTNFFIGLAVIIVLYIGWNIGYKLYRDYKQDQQIERGYYPNHNRGEYQPLLNNRQPAPSPTYSAPAPAPISDNSYNAFDRNLNRINQGMNTVSAVQNLAYQPRQRAATINPYGPQGYPSQPPPLPPRNY